MTLLALPSRTRAAATVRAFNRFPLRSRPAAAAASNACTQRLGDPVVSPLFPRRPWLEDDAAFQLGWDHAHHGQRPALEAIAAHPALKQGYQTGVAVFGRRTLKATAATRFWLNARLDALEHGRHFDAERVNARYLEQLDTRWCPVTRQPMRLIAPAPDTPATAGASSRPHVQALPSQAGQAVLARLRPDAGDVPGHLVALGRTAWLAMSRLGSGHRLDADQRARLDTLRSFADPLDHDAARRIPLRVLPPNRLHLHNPVQALQAVASRALARGDAGFSLLRTAMPGSAWREDLEAFASVFEHALLEARASLASHDVAFAERTDAATLQTWAIEDAWKSPRVLQWWIRLTASLSAEDCERIVMQVGSAAAGVFVETWADEAQGQHIGTSAVTNAACVPASNEGRLLATESDRLRA